MRRTGTACALALLVTAASLADARPALAKAANLEGFQEVPAVSTSGSGKFQAGIVGSEIRFTLSYKNTEGSVLQAHIHLGQVGVNGGIAAFLCTNLGNDPTGLAPLCPASPGTITGTIMAIQVIGPTGQGIFPGEFDELVRAIRSGATYVNVHTDLFPTGELRGQIP